MPRHSIPRKRRSKAKGSKSRKSSVKVTSTVPDVKPRYRGNSAKELQRLLSVPTIENQFEAFKRDPLFVYIQSDDTNLVNASHVILNTQAKDLQRQAIEAMKAVRG